MSGNVMSGSRRLGPACLSVVDSIRWSVAPADEKFLWKTTSTLTVASCLSWYVEPNFFVHLLLDRQKDEYLCSFLEVVSRLVIHHLLQPVVRLLLRVVVVVVVVAVAVAAAAGGGGGGDAAAAVVRPSPQKSSTSLASAPDSELVSATRTSLMASSSSFIFFWPLLKTHNCLPHLDYYVWLGTVADV